MNTAYCGGRRVERIDEGDPGKVRARRNNSPSINVVDIATKPGSFYLLLATGICSAGKQTYLIGGRLIEQTQGSGG